MGFSYQATLSNYQVDNTKFFISLADSFQPPNNPISPSHVFMKLGFKMLIVVGFELATCSQQSRILNLYSNQTPDEIELEAKL